MEICLCEGADIEEEVKDALDRGFKRLRYCVDPPPLKRHLPKRLFNLLQYRTTPLGSTLLDVVRVGFLHFDAEIGAYAPDQYAYDTYQLLYDRIFEERHGFLASQVHSKSNWGDWDRVPHLDPDGKYIISTRVRCARNLDGFRFSPTMSPVDFETVENVVVRMLELLPWEYSGHYLPMQSMTDKDIEVLMEKHLFFLQGNDHERAGNISRFWPLGRGIFVNRDFSFGVWVNEKDHLRAIAIEPGGNLREAYKRIAVVMPVLDKRLPPAIHERLGFLTVCPGNVGSALRLSVLMKMPNTPWEEIVKVAKVYRLEVDEIEKQVFCISNKRSLGYTEYAVAMQFSHGTREMIKLQETHEIKGTVIVDSDDSLDHEESSVALKEFLEKFKSAREPCPNVDVLGECPCTRPLRRVCSPRCIVGAMSAEIEYRRSHKKSISKAGSPTSIGDRNCESDPNTTKESSRTGSVESPNERQRSPAKPSHTRNKSPVKESRSSRRESGQSTHGNESPSVPHESGESMLSKSPKSPKSPTGGNENAERVSNKSHQKGDAPHHSEKITNQVSHQRSDTSHPTENESLRCGDDMTASGTKLTRRIPMSSKAVRGSIVKLPAIRSTRSTPRSDKKSIVEFTNPEMLRDKRVKKNWKQVVWI